MPEGWTHYLAKCHFIFGVCSFFWINNYTSMLVLHNSVFEYFLMSWIQLFKIQNTKRGGRGPQQVPRLPYARTFTSSNPLIFQLPSIQGGSLYLLYAKEASFQLNVVTGSFLSPHSVEVSLDTSCQECFRAEMFSIYFRILWLPVCIWYNIQ